MTDPQRDTSTWTYLSNHTHVLICLARDPELRLREIAEQVGLTERSVQAIVGDLEAAGAVTKTKVGRRNHYTVDPSRPLRHPVEAGHTIGQLLEVLTAVPATASSTN